MGSGMHLHGLSDWGKTEFHKHGYWTLDPMVMITEWVISTSSLEWLKWESCMVWWTDPTSRRRWYTRFCSVGRPIRSGLRSMETLCCQMVRMNDNYQGSEMKVPLFKHSTNTISPTDAKWAIGMENKAQLRSPGVLVRIRFHFVLDDYSDEYEMIAMVNWYLVNWIIASFGWTNMWWKLGAPV